MFYCIFWIRVFWKISVKVDKTEWPTPLHLILNVLGHRGLLIVYVLFCTFYQTLPSGPPCSEQQGHWLQARHETRVFEIPVNDSHTVSVLVSLMHLLQVRYRFFIHGARVARITGRSRPPGEVGLTPRQYTVWNVEGRTRSTGGLSLSRGCCLQCTVLPALGGILPNLELSHKEPKQQTPQPCAWVVYI